MRFMANRDASAVAKRIVMHRRMPSEECQANRDASAAKRRMPSEECQAKNASSSVPSESSRSPFLRCRRRRSTPIAPIVAVVVVKRTFLVVTGGPSVVLLPFPPPPSKGEDVCGVSFAPNPLALLPMKTTELQCARFDRVKLERPADPLPVPDATIRRWHREQRGQATSA